jgi:hypothetical protein
MTMIRSAAALAILAATAGCAYEGPAAGGATVRAIMASQMLPPTQQRAAGGDATAGAAAIENYRKSYVTPTPQGDATLLGNRK